MQSSFEVAALPYQDPSIKNILVLSFFLLLLNAINHILDNLIYCGLVGQVLIGIAFGTPGTKWLDKSTEQAIVQLGYLGLILLVYEGGLSTNFKSLKANAGISTLVALTGICLPVAFAFCLCSLVSATPLQAFTAGAALCSTSLGTTFSILSSSGLTNTRLGTVLTSAAMMDDVVGLMLVQVISKLGPERSPFHAITMVRPIAVSIGLTISVLFACAYAVKPLSTSISGPRSSIVMRVMRKHPDEVILIAHTAMLFGMVAVASYAGTSNLFAAYLTGASISWYHSEVAQLGNVANNECIEVTQSTIAESVQRVADGEDNGAKIENEDTLTDGIDRGATLSTLGASNAQVSQEPEWRTGETKRVHGSQRGVSIYKKYMEQPVARVLKPCFFASIGFSIPVTRMFSGAVIWRGIVFTILMLIGKLVTGIWLIRIVTPFGTVATKISLFLDRFIAPQWSCMGMAMFAKCFKSRSKNTAGGARSKATPDDGVALSTESEQCPKQSSNRPSQSAPVQLQPMTSAISRPQQASASLAKSRSLYPAAIVGTAMMARGEIGFLIAALAESTGIFVPQNDKLAAREDSGSKIYLIAIWAIFLCTVIGPVSVGVLVRRVKKLQRQRREHGGGEDPLGMWGVL